MGKCQDLRAVYLSVRKALEFTAIKPGCPFAGSRQEFAITVQIDDVDSCRRKAVPEGSIKRLWMVTCDAISFCGNPDVTRAVSDDRGGRADLKWLELDFLAAKKNGSLWASQKESSYRHTRSQEGIAPTVPGTLPTHKPPMLFLAGPKSRFPGPRSGTSSHADTDLSPPANLQQFQLNLPALHLDPVQIEAIEEKHKRDLTKGCSTYSLRSKYPAKNSLSP